MLLSSRPAAGDNCRTVGRPTRSRMSVPQSTSKKDPAARARLQAARAAAAAQAEAEAARKAAHQAAQAVPLPLSSTGLHQPAQGPPLSPVLTSHGSSISSHYSAQTVVPSQHHQPLHHYSPPPPQQHLYVNSSHGPSRTSLSVPPGANFGHSTPSSGVGGVTQGQSRQAAGGRPLSSSGPPRSALMQAPGLAHSTSQGALPVSAAYNLDRGPPSFSPSSSRPVSIGREPAAAPPPAHRHSQAGHTPDPHRQPAAPPPAPPVAQHGPPSSYASEPDSRRNTWASIAPGETSASPAMSAYAPSTYGGPPNAIAGPSSLASSDAPVASAKRSAESLIGYVRQIRHVLFRKSATDQFLIVSDSPLGDLLDPVRANSHPGRPDAAHDRRLCL